jgi:hypothetical protein
MFHVKRRLVQENKTRMVADTFLGRGLPVSFNWYFQFFHYDDDYELCAESAAGFAYRVGAVSAF